MAGRVHKIDSTLSTIHGWGLSVIVVGMNAILSGFPGLFHFLFQAKTIRFVNLYFQGDPTRCCFAKSTLSMVVGDRQVHSVNYN